MWDRLLRRRTVRLDTTRTRSLPIGAYIFNILMKLRQAKDILVSAGPPTLYTMAEAMDHVAEATRRVGRWIEQYGPLVQFAPGAGPPQPVLDDDAKKWLGELVTLRQEVDAAAQTARPDAAQMPVSEKAVDQPDPMTRANLLKEISDLIGRVEEVAQRYQSPTPAEVPVHRPDPNTTTPGPAAAAPVRRQMAEASQRNKGPGAAQQG